MSPSPPNPHRDRRAASPGALTPGVMCAVLFAVACGGSSRARRPPLPPRGPASIGECGDPSRDGAISATPRLRHADRDLDGDGVVEIVVTDDGLCTAEGNCHWNLFVQSGPGCDRYIGTVSGVGIEVLDLRGERGFHALRVWWRFTGDEPGARLLLQEYEFRHEGYRIVEALPCRRAEDDRVHCVPEADTSPGTALY